MDLFIYYLLLKDEKPEGIKNTLGCMHAKSALRQVDIVGQMQHDRGGFGLGATTTQRRKSVIAEVRQQQEVSRCSKAVLHSIQGQ